MDSTFGSRAHPTPVLCFESSGVRFFSRASGESPESRRSQTGSPVAGNSCSHSCFERRISSSNFVWSNLSGRDMSPGDSSGLLKELVRATFRRLGYFPARVGGVPYKVDPYHIGFWRSVSQGRWERHTFEILDQFLKEDSTFVDVGAWI